MAKLYAFSGDMNALPDEVFSPGNNLLQVFDTGAWKLWESDGERLFEKTCCCKSNGDLGAVDPMAVAAGIQAIIDIFVARARQRRADEQARGELQVAAYNAWQQFVQAVYADGCNTVTPESAVARTNQIIDEFNRYCTSLRTASVRRSCENIVREQRGGWVQPTRQLAIDVCNSRAQTPTGSQTPTTGSQTPTNQTQSLLTSGVSVAGLNVPILAIGAGLLALTLILK